MKVGVQQKATGRYCVNNLKANETIVTKTHCIIKAWNLTVLNFCSEWCVPRLTVTTKIQRGLEMKCCGLKKTKLSWPKGFQIIIYPTLFVNFKVRLWWIIRDGILGVQQAITHACIARLWILNSFKIFIRIVRHTILSMTHCMHGKCLMSKTVDLKCYFLLSRP